MNHMRFAYRVSIWIEHLPEQIEIGGPNYCIRPDCVGRA